MKRVLLFLGMILQGIFLMGQNSPKKYLKDVIHFPLGASVNPTLLNNDLVYRELAGSEFSSITAENHMKMMNVHPEADRFDFEKGDMLVNFAKNRQMRVHGHTLVWHNQVPTWMKDFKGDSAAWEAMLKNHIQTVAGYFKGRLSGWDVVNEAFLDDGSLRPTIWSEHIPDYLAKSFQWAREADPTALLFYNDYGQEGKPKKMQAILNMVADFRQRNIPIDGLGLQMHINVQTKDEAILVAINLATKTGLKIHFSELDVAVNPKNNPDFIFDLDSKDAQVNKYVRLFEAYREIPVDQQYGITFWNVGDQDSWLRGYFKRPKEYPLIFDESYKRKSAYDILYQQMSQSSKQRTIITTDGEIDDVDSFIRMLLYSNEFRLDGLIYSSSMWHYKGDGNGSKFTSVMPMTQKLYGERTELRWPGVDWIQDLVRAYAEVYPNLRQHAIGFPPPDRLQEMVRVGNINFEGDMMATTPGATWIRNKLLDYSMAPIYLQAWGGTNTIARALKDIEDEFDGSPDWPKIKNKVSQKAIIYTIMDQDVTLRDYISVHWPLIRVFYNSNQFLALAYPWKRYVNKEAHVFLSGKFMSEKIIKDHGALLAKYYSYGDGQKQVGDPEHVHGDPLGLKGTNWGSFMPFDFISEGDSPAFLHLVDVGLGNLNHPELGGWGGRFISSKNIQNRLVDGQQVAEFNPKSLKLDVFYPQARWIPALQQDFAARAEWCTKSFEEANHAPSVLVKGGNLYEVKPGSILTLDLVMSDPDSNVVEFSAWPYVEAGTGRGDIRISKLSKLGQIKISVPDVALKNERYHVILEVKDVAKSSISRYQRLILTVR